MNSLLIKQFKDREVKAKAIFTIREIPKSEAYAFVKQFHYLGKAKFFSNHSYGLFHEDALVGVSTFSNPQGTKSLDGWFGLGNDCTDVLELSRLCLLPELNGTNATSFLLGGSIKQLKWHGVRAVITLADSSRHIGSIYQVCNFKYYGLTDVKSDFVRYDGKVNPRGKTKGVRGVWVPRTRKHRYCYLIDTSLVPRYTQMPYPKKGDTEKRDCCGGTQVVVDKRYGTQYTCPVCCAEFSEKI